jgi:pullulanase/glycogen debranching enzyme
MGEADWNDPEARVLMLRMGGSDVDDGERRPEHETLLLVVNAGHAEVRFAVPSASDRHWRVLLATTAGQPHALDDDGGLTLPDRSMALLASRPVRGAS